MGCGFALVPVGCLVTDQGGDLLLRLDDPVGRQGGVARARAAREDNDVLWRGERVVLEARPGHFSRLGLFVGGHVVDVEDGAGAELADRARDPGAKRLGSDAVGGVGLDAQDETVPNHLVRLAREGVRLEPVEVRDLEVAAGERAVVGGEVLMERILWTSGGKWVAGVVSSSLVFFSRSRLGDGLGRVVRLRRHSDLEAQHVHVDDARLVDVRGGKLRGGDDLHSHLRGVGQAVSGAVHVLLDELLVERREAVGDDADRVEERLEVDRVGRRHIVVPLVWGDMDLLILHVVVSGVDEAAFQDRVEDGDSDVALDLECLVHALEDVLRRAPKFCGLYDVLLGRCASHVV